MHRTGTAHVGPTNAAVAHAHTPAGTLHVPPFMHCASVVHTAAAEGLTVGANVGAAVGAAVGGMVTGAAPPALAKLTWT